MDLFDAAAYNNLCSKPPPQDLNAEQATLGSMLIEPAAAERVLALLNDADFYREAHKEIYRAMQACSRRREPVDLITVSAELRREGSLDEVGGPDYLTAMIAEVPTTAHVLRYASIVHEKSRLRKAATFGMNASHKAYDQPDDVQAFLDSLEQQARDLACDVSDASKSVHIAELAGDEAYAHIDELIDIDANEDGSRRPRSGLPSLDNETGGLPMPGMVIDTGFTGSGKSTIAAMYAYDWSFVRGQPTAWFTTGEESKRDTILRMASIYGGLDLSPRGVKEACYSPEAREEFRAKLRGLADEVTCRANLHVQPRLISFDEFAGETRRLARSYGVNFVILDYLERCLHKEGNIRDPTRTLEAWSGRCQALKAELGITLLIISQITEDAVTGEAKTRYCSKLENDSDLTLRIDAAIKGTQEERRGQDKWQIIIRKRKRGRSGMKFLVTRRPEKFAEEELDAEPPRDTRYGLNE